MNTVVNPVGIFPVSRNDEGQLIHQTPEPLHPGYIKGESQAAKMAQQVLAQSSEFLARGNAKYIRRDVTLRDDLRGYRGEGFDQARRDTKAEIASHEDALTKASGFVADDNRRSYVIGSFQSMKPGERAEAIAALIEHGASGKELAILWETSPVFTGLTPELHATIKDRVFAKANPATFEALNTAKANYRRVEAASIAMTNALAALERMPDLAAPPVDQGRSVASSYASA